MRYTFTESNIDAKPWPADNRTYVDAKQVAAYLGYKSMSAFYRDKSWRAARGFPLQPLKRRWRARQIELWEARRQMGLGEPEQPANDIAPPRSDHPATSASDRMAMIRAQTAGRQNG